MAFSTDGKTLASSGADGTVRFWETAKGTPISAVGARRTVVRSRFVDANEQRLQDLEEGRLRRDEPLDLAA